MDMDGDEMNSSACTTAVDARDDDMIEVIYSIHSAMHRHRRRDVKGELSSVDMMMDDEAVPLFYNIKNNNTVMSES